MTEMPRPADPEQRLLILAPTPRDVRITCDILQRSGIECLPCADLPGLCRRLGEGAGGALITEEAFAGEGAKELLHFLAEQPPWSDLPIIFLTRRGGDSPLAQRAMESLGNILLLERPTKTSMLVSAARAALRERRRQYQTRSHLKMLREARDAAEEASRAKSEFLANMSHEIRTPMTVFMAAIEHLLQIDRSPERRHLLGMADQSAKRLRDLIDDILDFSRIEARKIELQQEPFDLDGCVRGAVEMFALVAQEKNIRLETDVSADAPRMVIGDPDRLSQVLINLIGNAVKFTRAGEIRVSVQPRGDLLEFAVADTGIGIPEEKRDLIFESFSQADASFTRSFGGTGLGLAISKGLVELMGGEIWSGARRDKGASLSSPSRCNRLRKRAPSRRRPRSGAPGKPARRRPYPAGRGRADDPGDDYDDAGPARLAGGDRRNRPGGDREMGERQLRSHFHGPADAGNERSGGHPDHPRPGRGRRKTHLHHRPDGPCAAGDQGGLPAGGNGPGINKACPDEGSLFGCPGLHFRLNQPTVKGQRY